MEIKDLKTHCVEQMRKLPKESRMYEEHLLTLSIIDTNKKYFDEIDKLSKVIDLMAEIFYKKFKAELLLEYGFEGEEQLKQYFKEIAERKSE